MDLSICDSPYYRFRNRDLVDWYLWNQSTVNFAKSENKDIRVVVGSYYSQVTHFGECRWYQNEAYTKSLNETYVNVLVDREENPAFVHLYRSIVSWTVNLSLAQQRMLPSADLPRVLVLDSMTLLPKFLKSEETNHTLLLADIDQSDLFNRIIPDRPQPQSSKVIQFPRRESQTEIPLEDYYEITLARSPVLDSEFLDGFHKTLEGFNADSSRVAAQLMDNVMLPAKIASYVLDLDQSDDWGDANLSNLAYSLLTQMGRSVCFDHLAGGFLQMHNATSGQVGTATAEKRLTVSAYLLRVYCRALETTDDVLFENVARLTAEYLHQQKLPGFLFPTTVCDTAHNDLTHYTWNKLNVKRQLTEDEFLVVETLYGLNRRPDYGRRFCLKRVDSWYSVLDQLFFEPQEAADLLESARLKLLANRNDEALTVDTRVNPVTCAAVSLALLKAGRHFQNNAYVDSAHEVMERLLDHIEFKDDKEILRLLNSADLIYMLDTLLEFLQDRWISYYYEICTFIGHLMVDNWSILDRSQIAKSQLLGNESDVDYEMVPEFFPIFDLQIDRESETAVLIRAFRRLASLHDNPQFKLVWQTQQDLVSSAVGENVFDYLEDVTEIMRSENPRLLQSTVLRGPVGECNRWRQTLEEKLAIPGDIYVIPYGPPSKEFLTPTHVPIHPLEGRIDKVMAYVSTGEQNELDLFDNLDELVTYLHSGEYV